jgi:cyclomaltodextrinase
MFRGYLISRRFLKLLPALALIWLVSGFANPSFAKGAVEDAAVQPRDAAEGQNLVTNPDFELTLPGVGQLGWSTWQKFNGSVFRTIENSSIAHSGTRCVEIEQTIKSQHNFAVWVQEVQVEAATTYRFSFWIRTDNVKPSVSSFPGTDGPESLGFVGFLNARNENLPSYYGSSSVLMTHDWQQLEISFVTSTDTRFVKINLALVNAVGKVYFDSVSLVASSFKKVPSPPWIAGAVVYELGPWQFSQFGNGNAFRGIIAKLPELAALGVNVLYLLPIWEDQGWYSVTDFFSIFSKYGTQEDFRTLVQNAHQYNMKVILDLAGTIGVPPESKLFVEHPEWFVLDENNSYYYSWPSGNMLGLDTNRPDVQQYFVEVAQYYVRVFDVDGYRCDSADASPNEMFEKIRTAIEQIKPDAIMIAEGDEPIYHETAFDATYDFRFLNFTSSLWSNPNSASKAAWWLKTEIDSYPAGALRLRYIEGHDLNYTAASKYGLMGSEALATFLFTIPGIPMIYDGQEVGNQITQEGPWAGTIDWNKNPEADQFRSFYTKLIHIRTDHPTLSAGAIVPVNSSDARVATFARTMNGTDPILVVINFSATRLNATLNVTPQMLGLQKTPYLVDLLGSDTGATTPNTGVLNMSLEPYQVHVYLLAENPTKNVVWRGSSGTWFVRYPDGSSWAVSWGKRGDTPLLGMISSDNSYDLIIFRRGTWFILTASSGYDPSQARVVSWGTSGDVPLVDGFGDLIIFRGGVWFILAASSYSPSQAKVVSWGTSGDVPLVDDQNDLIVFRNGVWFILTASSNYDPSKATIVSWGTAGDRPMVDAALDLVIYRNGVWFILNYSSNYTTSTVCMWGTSTDIPLVYPHGPRSWYL